MPRISAARANEQRGRILDAALTCFAREGFHAATIQDIVAESGLSPGASTDISRARPRSRWRSLPNVTRWSAGAWSLRLPHPTSTPACSACVDGFVLELRNPAERRWRHLAVQLWAESLSNPRLKREALGGVSQAVEVLSRMIAQAQSQGSWPKHLDPAYGRPCHDRHPAGHFVATGVGRARRYRTLCRGAANRCSIPRSDGTSPSGPTRGA